MTARRSYKVAAEGRLTTFLKGQTGSSDKEVKSLLHRGLCTVNGIKERFGSRELVRGDVVSIDVQKIAEKPSLGRERVLFENEVLLAYNKPAGATSEAVARAMATPLLHRLDKETSGVLLLVKKDKSRFIELFRRKQVKKGYVALVDGSLKEERGCIEKPLASLAQYAGQKVMGVSSQGAYAKTTYVVKKRYPKSTLVAICPVTGRTHQIRVHMASIGHPILGDFHYGKKFISPYKPTRILLHAAFMRIDGITIRAPLPPEFYESRSC